MNNVRCYGTQICSEWGTLRVSVGANHMFVLNSSRLRLEGCQVDSFGC